jgi:hypothetical protein
VSKPLWIHRRIETTGPGADKAPDPTNRLKTEADKGETWKLGADGWATPVYRAHQTGCVGPTLIQPDPVHCHQLLSMPRT